MGFRFLFVLLTIFILIYVFVFVSILTETVRPCSTSSAAPYFRFSGAWDISFMKTHEGTLVSPDVRTAIPTVFFSAGRGEGLFFCSRSRVLVFFS